jgi:NADH:ubiquinone oxidoreductase subunit 5 (subunit L)/multisubunit Na+/H+ antiporter MnhA subunit
MLLLMLAFVALFRMLSSVVLGEKPTDIKRGETGFSTLAPIAILMILILALGLYMPAPLNTILNNATQIVNAGMPVAQWSGSALTLDSIFGPAGLSQGNPFLSLFRIQFGN